MDILRKLYVKTNELARGQTMTEYALILAAVAVVVYAGYQTMVRLSTLCSQRLMGRFSPAPSPGVSIEPRRLETMKMFSKRSKGQVIVMFAGVVATLLAAVALGTDVAVMYLNWARMQKAADIAVLSGAGNLKNGTSSATNTCTSYLTSNGINTSTEILSAC